MTPVFTSALAGLAALLAKITLLLLTAWAASLLLRRSSAAVRHFVWASALGGVLLLPVLAFGLPRWNIALAPPSSQPAKSVKPSGLPVSATPDTDEPVKLQPRLLSQQTTPSQSLPPEAALAPMPRANTPVPTPLVCATAALTVWAFGFLFVMIPFAAGLRRISRVGAGAVPLPAPLLAAAHELRGHLGTRPAVFGRAAPRSGIVVPVTWGFFRPVVLLPEQSGTWPDACLRAALLHELAHVRRGDWLTQYAARFACAVYWWHPLVWVAAARLRAESERACDDLVLSTGIKPADYAQRLVEVVRSLPVGASSRTAAIAMAQPSEVEGRLKAVLDKSRKRGSLSQKGLALTLAACAVLLAAVSAFRLVARADGSTPAASVPIRAGFQQTLANGYTVKITRVVKFVAQNGKWNEHGPRWLPNGLPAATPPLDEYERQHQGQGFPVDETGGKTPYSVLVEIGRPHGRKPSPNDDFSFYEEPKDNIGALGVDGPVRIDGAILSCSLSILPPNGTRTCSVRYGIGTGPWQTVATLPVHLTSETVKAHVALSPDYKADLELMPGDQPSLFYHTASGQPVTQYFLGSTGKLGNVARRITAVDTAGRITPLIISTRGVGGKPFIDLSLDKRGQLTEFNPTVDLAQVKEFRLQTRLYQSVEFRNIPLQPTPTAGNSQPLTTDLMHPDSSRQVERAMALRAHLQPWAEENKALLQQMARSKPNDYAALLAVYAAFDRLPLPLWPADPRVAQGPETPPFSAITSSPTLTHLQRSRTAEDVQIRENFAQYRDLEVSQSVGVGRVHLTLWASGRITRSTERDQYTGPGKPILTVEDQQEIVPGFFRTDNRTTMPQSKTSVGFKRYTSPPLPDGSRYTFLYPAYYTKISPGWLDAPYQFGTVRMDCLGSQSVPWIARPGQKPVVSVANHAPAPHEESFSVEVSKARVTARPIPQAQVNNSQWVGINGSHHALTLTDARTGYRFVLIHDDRYTPEIFKQTDPVIMASFLVLRTGQRGWIKPQMP